jgi:hypothetical protein
METIPSDDRFATSLDRMMSARFARDLIRDSIVERLQTIMETLPENVRSLLAEDEIAALEFQRSVLAYRESAK